MFLSANYRLFVSRLQTGELLSQLQTLEAQARHQNAPHAEHCLRLIESIRSNYRASLNYKMSGAALDEGYNNVIADLWKRTYSVFLSLNSPQPTTNNGATLLNEARLRLEDSYQKLDFLCLSGQTDDSLINNAHQAIEAEEQLIFQYICPPSAAQTVLHAEWTAPEAEVISQILNSPAIGSDSKDLFRSAIMLSCMQAFDSSKLGYITQTAELCFPLYVHRFLFNTLSKSYPTLLPDHLPKIETETLQFLQLHILQYNHNLHLQEHIQDELLTGGLQNIKKLGIETLEDLLDPDNDMFGEPPGQAQFEETLKNNMHRMVELQEAHADAYYNSFRNLKHFPFFSKAANWFRAFDPQNTQVAPILATHKGSIAQAIWKRGEMCDADLYSLLFMLAGMPGKTTNSSRASLADTKLSDILGDEEAGSTTHDPTTETKKAALHRFWECYRFFNLYKGGENPFPNGLNDYLSQTAKTDDELMLLGRIDCFSQYLNHHTTAIQLAQTIRPIAPKAALSLLNLALKQTEQQNSTEDPDLSNLNFANNPQADDDAHLAITRLRARLLAELGKHSEAVIAFEQIRLTHNLRPSEAELLAKSLKAIGSDSQATKIYAALAAAQPDSPRYLRLYALNLLQTQRYDEALKQLLTIEILQGSDQRLNRAIAWCLLSMGRAHDAEQRYSLLLNDSPTATDFLNAGHAALALGNIRLAQERYKAHRNLSTTSQPFQISPADRQLLAKTYGITTQDCQLLVDYINF